MYSSPSKYSARLISNQPPRTISDLIKLIKQYDQTMVDEGTPEKRLIQDSAEATLEDYLQASKVLC